MCKLKLDKTRNILKVTFEGIIDKQQAEELHAEVLKIATQLKQGFTLLSDRSLLKKMDVEVHKVIEKTMDIFNQCGVSKVIRIMPSQVGDIGFNIMSLFHYSKDVKIYTYESLEQAKKHLS